MSSVNGPTKVYYRINIVEGARSVPVEYELEFVKWTGSYLHIKAEGGKLRRIGRNTLRRHLVTGRMRIEGYRPTWLWEK